MQYQCCWQLQLEPNLLLHFQFFFMSLVESLSYRRLGLQSIRRHPNPTCRRASTSSTFGVTSKRCCAPHTCRSAPNRPYCCHPTCPDNLPCARARPLVTPNCSYRAKPRWLGPIANWPYSRPWHGLLLHCCQLHQQCWDSRVQKLPLEAGRAAHDSSDMWQAGIITSLNTCEIAKALLSGFCEQPMAQNTHCKSTAIDNRYMWDPTWVSPTDGLMQDCKTIPCKS